MGVGVAEPAATAATTPTVPVASSPNLSLLGNTHTAPVASSPNIAAAANTVVGKPSTHTVTTSFDGQSTTKKTVRLPASNTVTLSVPAGTVTVTANETYKNVSKYRTHTIR